MDFLNVYYVLACVFGLGLAGFAAYGIWVKPDLMRDKSVVPVVIVSLLLLSVTLGSAIVGAINEHENEDEPPPMALPDDATK